jgi:hypothetical protein
MTPEGKVAAAIRRKLIAMKKSGHPIWFVKIAGGHRQRPGLPDTHITYDGWSVWIEAKRPGGKPTNLQEKTMREIRDAGGVAECIDDADAVEGILLWVAR